MDFYRCATSEVAPDLHVLLQGWVGGLHEPLEEVQDERVLQLMAGRYLEHERKATHSAYPYFYPCVFKFIQVS